MTARTKKGKIWIAVLTGCFILCLLCGCQYSADEEKQQDRITAESENKKDGTNEKNNTNEEESLNIKETAPAADYTDSSVHANGSIEEPAIDTVLADVISSYADYLQEYCGQSSNFTANNLHFSLVYIDEDNIPELAVIEDDSHPSGVHICVYRDGAVIEIGEFGSFGAFLYSFRQNVIYSGFSNMGEGFTSIFCIDGNDSTELQSFHTYPAYDENDEYEKDIYELDGLEVSEEAFDEAYEKWRTGEMESLSYRSPSCFLFTDKDNAYSQMIDILFLLQAEGVSPVRAID